MMTEDELKDIEARHGEERVLYWCAHTATFERIGGAIPALVAEVRRLKAVVAGYADHWFHCPAYDNAGACTCGFSEKRPMPGTGP